MRSGLRFQRGVERLDCVRCLVILLLNFSTLLANNPTSYSNLNSAVLSVSDLGLSSIGVVIGRSSLAG